MGPEWWIVAAVVGTVALLGAGFYVGRQTLEDDLRAVRADRDRQAAGWAAEQAGRAQDNADAGRALEAADDADEAGDRVRALPADASLGGLLDAARGEPGGGGVDGVPPAGEA